MSVKKGGSRTGSGKELEAIALILAENPILRKRVETAMAGYKKRWSEKKKTEG